MISINSAGFNEGEDFRTFEPTATDYGSLVILYTMRRALEIGKETS
jgi:hypothetical protein